MREKRTIFDKVAGAFKNVNKIFSSFKLFNAFTAVFTSFGQDAYKSDITRAAIEAIAKNAAKLKPKHVVSRDGKQLPKDRGSLDRIIAERPNPLMSAYDFYLKIITQLYNKNNAFVLIDRDYATGMIYNLLPISYSMVEAMEYENDVYLKFTTLNGDILTIPYADVIHLRRFFYDQDVFGEDNTALLPTLELINTINQGVSNAVTTSASLRGILKATGVLNEKDRTKTKDDFVRDYLTSANNGGVAVLDSKFDYVPLKSEPVLIDKAQMDAIKTQVYDYFNINTDIVQSKWDEEKWNAFYEGVLEPLAIQMSLEFTNKLFSKTQIQSGNKIIFEANRLAYASNQTKISLVKEVGALGGFTINEIRELFNMAPIDGGEVRLQTLNVVNAALADQYQTGKEVEEEDDETNGSSEGE